MPVSETYLAWLEKMADLHRRKSAGYDGASNVSWANMRACEAFGIPAEIGCLTRMSDKWTRLLTLVADPANDQVGEPIEDTTNDLASYAGIFLDLRREREERHTAGRSTPLESRWFYPDTHEEPSTRTFGNVLPPQPPVPWFNGLGVPKCLACVQTVMETSPNIWRHAPSGLPIGCAGEPTLFVPDDPHYAESVRALAKFRDNYMLPLDGAGAMDKCSGCEHVRVWHVWSDPSPNPTRCSQCGCLAFEDSVGDTLVLEGRPRTWTVPPRIEDDPRIAGIRQTMQRRMEKAVRDQLEMTCEREECGHPLRGHAPSATAPCMNCACPGFKAGA